jgi:hypothetical protein
MLIFYAASATALLAVSASTDDTVQWATIILIVLGGLLQRWWDYNAKRERDEQAELLASKVESAAVALASKTDATKEEIVGKIDQNTAVTEQGIEKVYGRADQAFTESNGHTLKILQLRKELADALRRLENVQTAKPSDIHVTLQTTPEPPQGT